MEKNQKVEVTPKIIYKMLLTVVSALAIITIITLITNHKTISENQKIIDKTFSEMIKREQVALKQGFRWGVRALGMEVTSGCFHENLEDLKNTPEEDLIEFRFKDGKIGRIKHWKTKGE